MRTDTARTISTVAIWGAVAGILMTLRINGSSSMITEVFVGMTAFLSLGAAIATSAVWWRAPQQAEPAKDVHPEL